MENHDQHFLTGSVKNGATIRAVVLAKVDRHSQNRLCYILGCQVRAIRELDALFDLEGIGFSILAHGPIFGQHAHDLALGIVLKQGIVEVGEIVGDVVTGGGHLRGDDGVKILKAPALRQIQMYGLSLGVLLRVLAASLVPLSLIYITVDAGIPRPCLKNTAFMAQNQGMRLLFR